MAYNGADRLSALNIQSRLDAEALQFEHLARVQIQLVDANRRNSGISRNQRPRTRRDVS